MSSDLLINAENKVFFEMAEIYKKIGLANEEAFRLSELRKLSHGVNLSPKENLEIKAILKKHPETREVILSTFPCYFKLD